MRKKKDIIPVFKNMPGIVACKDYYNCDKYTPPSCKNKYLYLCENCLNRGMEIIPYTEVLSDKELDHFLDNIDYLDYYS